MVIFTVWIVFIPLEQKANFSQLKVCENKDICNIMMPSQDTTI